MEYHRDSEFNLGSDSFILLLAKQDESENGKLDTAKVKAFSVPAGVLVELYATTLHYAPCSEKIGSPFHVMVALPKGTNTDKPVFTGGNAEDSRLRACNKWLLAHTDALKARDGAYVGLFGENIDIANILQEVSNE